MSPVSVTVKLLASSTTLSGVRPSFTYSTRPLEGFPSSLISGRTVWAPPAAVIVRT